MAGNCIIEVDELYLTSLIGVIEFCHQEMAEDYRKYLITGFSCCNTCNVSLENLMCLSDIIFFLNIFDVNTDDCKYIHLAKEKAMQICTFNESNINDNLFENAILMEDGTPILSEDNVSYFSLEG